MGTKARGRSVVPNRGQTLRTRSHYHHLKPRLLRLGNHPDRRLARPTPPPWEYRQSTGPKLSAQGQGKGWNYPPDSTINHPASRDHTQPNRGQFYSAGR